MKTIRINTGELNSMDKIHSYLKKEMDFPDYYGNNLDALYDMLTETCEEYDIVFEKSYDEDALSLKYFEVLLSVFEAAQEENEGIRLTVVQ